MEDLDVKERVEGGESKTLRKHILHSSFSEFMNYLGRLKELVGEYSK